MEQYVISKEQIEKISQHLLECPAKFAIPVVDILRQIVAQQKVEEKK